MPLPLSFSSEGLHLYKHRLRRFGYTLFLFSQTFRKKGGA